MDSNSYDDSSVSVRRVSNPQLDSFQPLQRPNSSQQSSHGDQQRVNDETTAISQLKDALSGHDVLGTLFEAVSPANMRNDSASAQVG